MRLAGNGEDQDEAGRAGGLPQSGRVVPGNAARLLAGRRALLQGPSTAACWSRHRSKLRIPLKLGTALKVRRVWLMVNSIGACGSCAARGGAQSGVPGPQAPFLSSHKGDAVSTGSHPGHPDAVSSTAILLSLSAVAKTGCQPRTNESRGNTYLLTILIGGWLGGQ